MSKDKDPFSPHISGWLITINTNRTDTELLKPIIKIWTHIISNMQLFAYGRGEIVNVKEDNRTWERGEKYHRIHLHTRIEILANGIASIDYTRINNFFNRQLSQIPNFNGIYFNARLIKNLNSKRQIEEYLKKAPFLFDDMPDDTFKLLELID